MDLNKVMIIGRLVRDPEMRTTGTGQTVTSFSVATNFTWKDQQGQQQERVEYHNVVAWRRLAEIVGQYLTKGRQVYIEGRLQTRSWEDQQGQKRYRTEVVADNMIMLGSRGEGGPAPTNNAPAATTPEVSPSSAPASSGPAPAAAPSDDEISIEDIPF